MNVPGRLAGRRVLITGAAAGIGAATVARFEAEGAVVVGLDADPGYDGVVGDVANPDDVARAVAAAGGLDVLVANAGISVMEPFLAGDPTSWQRVLRVNLLGVLVCFQAAARAMVEHGRGGRLLATASIAGLAQGEAGGAPYAASKAGIGGVIKSLAVELAPHGIRVAGVAPGQVDTALNAADIASLGDQAGRSPDELRRELVETRVPARRMGTPQEIAAAFAWLASDEADFVTGHVLVVDGGESIA
jgi:NAD(P)-dependent dehydrogenase (short-subunit alcohol dehydrogenase family)